MSEILIRDVATGEAVAYTEHTVDLSSAAAPWRDLLRLERSRKALKSTEISTVWAGLALVRSEGILDRRLDAKPLQSIDLKPGDVLISPQGASIYVSIPRPLELTCIQLAPTVLLAVAEELGASSWVTSEGAVRDEQLEAMAALLESEVRAKCPGGRLFGEYLAYALGAHLIQRYAARRDSVSAPQRRLRNGKLSAVLDYIHAHATRDLSLHELARAVELSPFHFSRLFKNSTGVTPHQYVLQWRIDEAKRLLRHSRLDLAEIANRLGFRDQSHFTARFRKLTGDTPKRWRESA